MGRNWPINGLDTIAKRGAVQQPVVDHFLSRGLSLSPSSISPCVWMLNVSYRRRERKRSVILSIFSHIDRTGRTVGPSVFVALFLLFLSLSLSLSLSLYAAPWWWWWWWWWMTPVCRFHQVSVSIKTPFLFLARLGVGCCCCCCCPRVPPFSKPPPHQSPAPQRTLQRNITHTHKVPRPLVQGLHTLFLDRTANPFLFFPWFHWRMERTTTANVCVCCVCVHLSVWGIVCTFFRTIVSLHKPPTFWGTNHFLVF